MVSVVGFNEIWVYFVIIYMRNILDLRFRIKSTHCHWCGDLLKECEAQTVLTDKANKEAAWVSSLIEMIVSQVFVS